MHPAPTPQRPARLLAVVALAVSLGALATLLTAPRAPGQESGETPPVGDFDAAWKEVDRLLSEDKVEAAAERAAAIRQAARQAGDAEELTRALVKEVQLRTALHGYETAVRFLMDEPWPEDPRSRVVLDLFYAQSLVTYWQAYSWEISQRQRLDSGDTVDLKRWTREQIFTAAQQAFAGVWSRRREWGAAPVGEIAEYLRQNNYPPRIRGTLRDAVSYLWVELLANTGFWRPEQQEGVYRLDLERLVAADAAALADVPLAAADTHPLVQLAAVLADLEAWHAGEGRPEAAFEARRERLERLSRSFTREDDRGRIRRELEARLDALGRRYSWWSLGMATRAEMVRQEGDPESRVRARAIALEGELAHPSSVGGERCRSIAASIEAPAFGIEAMGLDGVERRSIQVTHRNLLVLYFRAYPVDLFARLAAARDYDLLPGTREVRELLEHGTPTVEWVAELPPTPDYRDHVTYVTPPVGRPGLWVVVASAQRDFGQTGNQLVAVDMVVGDLVLLRREEAGGIEVEARSGRSGFPLADVAVYLYRYDWQHGHRRLATVRTGVDGRSHFDAPPERGPYFLAAQLGPEVTVDADAFYRQPAEVPGRGSGALLFTDRSVYRPGQEVLWKVVAYRGGGEESRYETAPGSAVTVELADANGEVVGSATVTTNDFGTASGRLSIPPGRLLGSWELRSSWGGSVRLQVEEYKRPTFEVSLAEPAEALSLNRPARLTGEARYYFGLPVATGQVTWRVVRQPLYPWWWSWVGGVEESAETIAAGDTELDDDGSFTLAFTPEADARQAASGVTYSYRVEAEVTDEGGETRDAARSFRLGFVAVETTIDAAAGFYRPGRPVSLTLRRHDLDGTPRPGDGRWRLLHVVQPDAAVLPADQPLPPPPGPSAYRTPGDALRPRWPTDYSPELVLRGWPDGGEVAAGVVEHGDDGVGEVALPALAAGVYRLRYETEDPFGGRFDTAEELVVAGDGAMPLALPLLLRVERSSVPVGGTARLLVHSGLPHQEMVLEIYRRGRRVERRVLASQDGLQVIEIPIAAGRRGGFGVALTALRDHQLMRLTGGLVVPWDDRELHLEFATFRDRLRPGTRESWRVTVRSPDGEPVGAAAAELLAYMYDRSLDLFAPHRPPSVLRLYPELTGTPWVQTNLGLAPRAWAWGSGFGVPGYPGLHGDALVFYSGSGIGGPGRWRWGALAKAEAARSVAVPAPVAEEIVVTSEAGREGDEREAANQPPPAPSAPAEPLRSDFSETAFFEPHLLTGDDGSVAFELEVPDSVTEWSVWVHAVTRDLKGGSLERRTRSVKELMVRPYLPRFLREGDRAEVAIVVNDAGEEPLAGHLTFDIVDPESGESRLAEFGVGPELLRRLAFAVEPGGGTTLKVPLQAPSRLGTVAIEVRGTAGSWSDGERRPLLLLPGRVHLAQSRFVALHDADRRTLAFDDLADAADDPSLRNDQLVVTVDGQLFYGVLAALPYLVSYPYECTEQTLNRFLSTGIVSSVFADYPAVARMAKRLAARRDTRLETWEAADPNRKMALVETPWLEEARGGGEPAEELLPVLDPRVAEAQRDAALAKLGKAQTSLGAFPWWPGGPPSPYMTLYVLYGFSKALEFGVEVPRGVIERAWGYMHRHYVDELVRRSIAADCCWEMVTFLNFVLSSYPESAWSGGVFTPAERREMLAFSFRHWRDHAPLSKAQLALTLARMDRPADARLVFDSIMDSAKTSRDEGTYWAPEDRAWLWYNDTIETHAMALRALTELKPDDARRHGLVQWLFLNKKLNHWKSTRATAEVIYSLVHYLQHEGALAVRETVAVDVGPALHRELDFPPDELTATKRQIVVPGSEVTPAMGEIVVAKETPGFAFASATWHFSTEKLPEEAVGDLFHVERSYYRRVHDGREWTLQPLAPGAALAPGDQVEVELSIRTRHAAEYVHLRDPRGAGFEPESLTSRFKWDLGLGYYEEVRDSGTSFFFEWLPAGEYTFHYRLRANVRGTFHVGPATLQSMYAPEFTAYSAGRVLEVR